MTGIFLALLLLSVSSWYGRAHGYSHGQLLPRVDSGNCTRFIVSGSIPGYFQNHAFYDFRQLGDYASASPPAKITSKQDSGDENVTSTYFNTTAFQGWNILSGVRSDESTVPMIYSAQNIFISDANSSDDGAATYLSLRTSRLSAFQSMAEIKSTSDNYLHASLRIRAKFLASSDADVASGAVFGFFTYKTDNQESDIEILTAEDADTVHFTNQPASDEDEAAHAIVSLPDGKHWTDWVTYRLDWFNGTSAWYIDDEPKVQSTDSVPTEPSSVVLNLWSNGQSFSGKMAVGKEVLVAVEWIEMVYNVSDSQVNTASPVTCKVDGVSVTGQAEVVVESKSKSNAIRRSEQTTTSFLGVILAALFLAGSFDLV
ncbi:hypothetical protein A1O3_07693 [Capronia epimyces CBS 606.96]|uniref:GH16 domain-containing protein n=1 Tax=Capronia epimyces CBS 606.96 TaxID=1182542 RepID=W9XLL5_9EURO|nr:uncharacterized protein A1O3_07693 [Capronia epimyces CBS 606.96]EXJ81402.1 hypothetical protein A1O3_07693 [Capronia epimyces CBS 606.96]